MKYCRLQTQYGAQYAEVVEHDGQLWIERLIPPFEEDPASDFVGQEIKPLIRCRSRSPAARPCRALEDRLRGPQLSRSCRRTRQ